MTTNEYKTKLETAKKYTLFNQGMLGSLCTLVEKTIHIEGDIVECGSYRGGSSMTLAACAEYCSQFYGIKLKHVFAFDSFEGMIGKYQDREEGEFTDVNFNEVLEVTKSYQNLTLIKGIFQNTLPYFVNSPLSLIHLDCDLYDSYKVAFEYLWPKLSKDGVVILADYRSNKNEGATIACNEFFGEEKIKEQYGVFIVHK